MAPQQKKKEVEEEEEEEKKRDGGVGSPNVKMKMNEEEGPGEEG